MRKVRFILTINDVNHTVNPVWGNDVVINITRAQGYRALRQALEGGVTFVREDYDLINSQSFEQQFWLTVQVDDGSGYYDRIRGYFYKTYLRHFADTESKAFELLKLVTDDLYERVINSLNSEYNLPDIGVASTDLKYVLQPVLQVYRPGSLFITNINGGNSWEQPVTQAVTDLSELTGTYLFFEGKAVYYVAGEGNLAPDVSGPYEFNGTSGFYEHETKSFSFRFDGGSNTWNIHEDSGGGIVYTGTASETDEFASVYTTGGSDCQLAGGRNYFRMLCNSATLGGTPTQDVPASDIVVQNNYTKILPIAYQNIFGSDANQVLPTGYGRFAADAEQFPGRYFDFPVSAVTEHYFPVGRSNWNYFSQWCFFDATLQGYQEEGSEERIVSDAYKFADVLSAVLGEIDPELSHEESAAFSDFLYGNSNPIRSSQSTPFLVPKTNITVGDYDIPAKKVPVTLRDLLDFAWACWRAGWHIDSEGRFVIEHVSYYEAGKTYSGNNVLFSADSLVETKNQLSWQHGQRIYDYKLDNMPARIEKNYSEDASPVFDGLPIEVLSVYVNPGTTEQYSLSRFFADIDFALVSEVSRDGMFYCEAVLDGGVQTVTFDTVTYRGKDYKLQNGRASWPYMDNLYGRHNLPAESARLNGETITASSVRKSRRTSLAFAGIDADGLDYMELVTLDSEQGEIAKAEVQLATGNIAIEEIQLPL